ncbi:MAG: bacteriohemerythrin [Desulfobacteraceae bacterium]|nr:bacteriohemerythrin [Desulfobacteraceae bacterium]
MALIQWSDKLSVRVAEIDQQHQKMIEMINALTDAIRQGKGDDVIQLILRGLKSYAEVHFKTEENYFKQFGYPEAQNHKKEHLFFIQKVSEFESGSTGGQLRLTIQVLQFLSDWLINHILGTDKAYSDCFNQNGLK